MCFTSSLFLQEAGRHRIRGDDPTFSALDEDDFQTVILENKLGCDIYLKKVEHSDTVDQLNHGDYTSVWIPPPRFSDRLNVADESREERYYVAIQILEAKVVTVAKVNKILMQTFFNYLHYYFLERTVTFSIFSRVYQSLMMEIAIIFSVLCALSLIVRQQINKSFFLRAQGRNVLNL
jgi:hypothetical protein